MSATLSRLILSMTLIFATPVFFVLMFWLSYAVFDGPLYDEFVPMCLATGITLGGLIGGWLAIWRGEIAWTRRRIQRTIGVAVMYGVLGVSVLGGTMALATYEGLTGGVFLGGLAFALAWLAGTAIAWRESAAERAERLQAFGVGTVACPTCGYNLTGLRNAHCPECGSRFTLDQLHGEMLEQRGETTRV
jgi:uncharacterized membrane protein YozB (DUF420 family)